VSAEVPPPVVLVVIIEVLRWMLTYGSLVDVGGIIIEAECCSLGYDYWIDPGKDSFAYRLTP
jgi:hypothetical protein